MVDLVFGIRKPIAAALASAALLAGCMHPATSIDQPHGRSGSQVRKAISEAMESGDNAMLTRRAIELARMGGSLSAQTLDRIEPQFDAGVLADAHMPAATLRSQLATNGTTHVYDASWDFAQVPADYRLVEGIAWDAVTSRLFVGTVVEGRLTYRGTDGNWHDVPLGSPRASLFGMAIDTKRRLLWIATGSLEQTAVAGERMTGLIAVDLDTLKVVRRVPIAPGGAGTAGDLTIAGDGTVYVSNVASGAIHRCAPGCTLLEDWKPAGTFRNPQGLVLSPDGSRLYVADYVTGLWVIDVRSGASAQIGITAPTMLEGIDGLIMGRRGTLVAIQNGTRPRRIVEIALDPGGRRITAINVMAHFRPDDGEATLGVIRGSELLFVADSQWERYGPGGLVSDAKPARPTRIGRIELGKPAAR